MECMPRRSTTDELIEQFKKRDLKTELEWAATHTPTGYMPRSWAEYYSCLAAAAARRIKELEEKEG